MSGKPGCKQVSDRTPADYILVKCLEDGKLMRHPKDIPMLPGFLVVSETNLNPEYWNAPRTFYGCMCNPRPYWELPDASKPL